MKFISTRILTSTTLILALAGCEKAEPTSYLIPKEERNATMPSPVADSAKQAPVASGGGMQVLPGMQATADGAGAITYDVPEGWEDVPPSGIRKANLTISDDNGIAELTVLVFPGDVGGRLANINRWRGQIGLEAATADNLAAFTENYTISAHGGLYVRLEGGEQSILGALLPFHGNTWFFKLHGNSGTVLTNETGMKAFLDSVKLVDTHH